MLTDGVKHTYVVKAHYRKRGAIGVIQQGEFVITSEVPIQTRAEVLRLWELVHGKDNELFYIDSWSERNVLPNA